MPIRLNLLAEAQAAEEARRRDPVKRAVWVAALIIVLILVYSSSLQLKAMLINNDLSRLEGKVNARTSDYREVLDSQTKTAEIRRKLEALERLTANRRLQGTLLNAIQETTVPDVQLLRLRLDQTYACFEGTKSHTNDEGVLIAGKLPTNTEKTLLVLEGADSCGNPGDQVNKYKTALATNDYLKTVLIPTNGISLRSLAPPQVSPFTAKRSANFTLECRYPDKTR